MLWQRVHRHHTLAQVAWTTPIYTYPLQGWLRYPCRLAPPTIPSIAGWCASYRLVVLKSPLVRTENRLSSNAEARTTKCLFLGLIARLGERESRWSRSHWSYGPTKVGFIHRIAGGNVTNTQPHSLIQTTLSQSSQVSQQQQEPQQPEHRQPSCHRNHTDRHHAHHVDPPHRIFREDHPRSG